jgi:predicted dehydrogenase
MTAEKVISVAIVGTGFIGPAHLEGLRRHPGVQAVGLVEMTPELAVEKAAALGIPKAYKSFEEMLADPRVDVVVLATPNYLHYPQAKAALEAGKHVICEKPLALTTSQSSELVDLAAKKKLVNAVNFNLRFYPLMHQARSMVKNGDLGDVFILQGSYLQDWLLYATDWNWRLEPHLSGNTRAVADIGSHWLDLLTFITALRVEEVFADFKTFHPVRKKPKKALETFTGKLLKPEDYEDKPISTEDYATILLHFAGGARGVLTVGQVCAGRKNRLFFEIDGSKAGLSFDSEHPNELWVGRRDGPNQVIMKDPSLLSAEARAITSYPGGHIEGFPDTFKQLGGKVYTYIRQGDFTRAPDFPTFADGHYELMLNEAIEQSAHQNRWIKIQY